SKPAGLTPRRNSPPTYVGGSPLSSKKVGMSGQQNSLVAVLRRTFKIGSAIIQDPAPTLPLSMVQQILSATYPQVRWTQLYDSDAKVVGDTLEYEFLIPPVKTNG
ncbi:PRTRC system protein C, partial [Pseudaeromonas pectinilytica]